MALNNDTNTDEESLDLPEPSESTLVDFSLDIEEINNNDDSEIDSDENSND